MVASAVFITDLSGKPLISRNYRGDIPLTSAIEKFASYLLEVEDDAKKPVFHVDSNGDFLGSDDVGCTGAGGETFVYVQQNNLYLCSVTCKNSNVVLMLTYLNQLTSLFQDYFTTLNEESIRDNFVIIYERGNVATVGITDFAQAALGDIVFVDLPEPGDEFDAKDSFGSVESVKAASDVYSPVSGKVLEVNEALTDEPALVNSSAEDDAWFIKLEVGDDSELGELMNADQYKDHCEKEAH